ncbi:UNVERIFIED_CONTAM: hypothetical protein HDU68_004486 [Siphonaria sp. JEL0065]|nr:hypothetical protein HDU68_004486 [Siphonaria sp. JEL0065]
MTALSTLRLPSHTIVLALYFVHKLLSVTLSKTNGSAASLMTSITSFQETQQFPSILAPSIQSQFSTSPVGLFLAGLMFADTVLCDAPVSVSTWTWILNQSCPPFSPMCARLKHQPTFARDVRKWGLDLLEFDLNVRAEKYQGWLNSVKGFVEQQEQEKRRSDAAAAVAALSASSLLSGTYSLPPFMMMPVAGLGGGAFVGGGSFGF